MHQGSTSHCPRCGHHVEGDDQSCGRCGRILDRDSGGQGKCIELHIGPLPGGGSQRIVRLPRAVFLGGMGLVVLASCAVVAYACYRAGLLQF